MQEPVPADFIFATLQKKHGSDVRSVNLAVVDRNITAGTSVLGIFQYQIAVDRYVGREAILSTLGIPTNFKARLKRTRTTDPSIDLISFDESLYADHASTRPAEGRHREKRNVSLPGSNRTP